MNYNHLLIGILFALFINLFSLNFTLSQTNPFKVITINSKDYFLYPEFEEYGNEEDLNGYDVYKLLKMNPSMSLDGDWVKLFDTVNNYVAASFSVKNNYLDGKFEQFYYNGNVRLSGSFIKNVKDGKWQYFYENGSPNMIESYIVKESNFGTVKYRFGEWSYWNEDGTLIEQKNFDSTGLLDGIYEEFYNNGSKKEIRPFQKGKLTGISQQYDKYGNLITKFEYHNNFTNKPGTIYYNTGEKLAIGNAFTNCKIEKWEYFYPNGKLNATGSYKLFLTEICISAIQQNYYHSVKNGRWIYWYASGNVMAYGDYAGIAEETTRGIIYKSKRVGEWTFFDEFGNFVDYEFIRNKGISIFNEDQAFLP
jgi:antitoxin component YwqK of YwqJK toxin-antitoxin module